MGMGENEMVRFVFLKLVVTIRKRRNLKSILTQLYFGISSQSCRFLLFIDT